VGTSLDLPDQREVTKEEAEALAEELKVFYAEVSAKTGEGITELRQKVSEDAQRHFLKWKAAQAKVEPTP
jgi:Fe2+ transport system protein B